MELGISGKVMRVERVHVEEDSVKMSHAGDGSGGLGDSTSSHIDFNRAGVPLMEVVSKPDVRSGSEAAGYG